MDGESFGGGGQRNVLGGVLITCSVDPVTGFYRDGCCNTGMEDAGSHTVCAVMNDNFLAFVSLNFIKGSIASAHYAPQHLAADCTYCNACLSFQCCYQADDLVREY